MSIPGYDQWKTDSGREADPGYPSCDACGAELAECRCDDEVLNGRNEAGDDRLLRDVLGTSEGLECPACGHILTSDQDDVQALDNYTVCEFCGREIKHGMCRVVKVCDACGGQVFDDQHQCDEPRWVAPTLPLAYKPVPNDGVINPRLEGGDS